MKGRALLAVLLLAGAAFLASCGGAEAVPSVSLLPLARAVDPGAPGEAVVREPWRLAGQEGPLAADRPVPVRAGRSQRLAAITGPGVAWEVEVELRRGDRLTFAVTAPPPAAPEQERDGGNGAGDAGGAAASPPPDPAVPVEARVSLLGDDGDERVLDRSEVGNGRWSRRTVTVDRAGAGRLRLSSGDGIVAWAGGLLVRAEPREPARPNLLLVSIDTLRADRLGVYGNPRRVTPNLDGLAADSLVFERALSTSTWTLPSHASMFTGLLPAQHGLVHHEDRLPEGSVTVAGRLRELGYHTVAITDGGFLNPRWGLAQGFDRWDWTEGHPWQPKDVRQVVRQARRWLQANGYEPYFLFVHTYETHQPYTNAEGFADPFLPAGASGEGPVAAFDLRVAPTDPLEARRALAFYDGGVARVDHHLGGWLTDLAASGALDDTAVVVTSDHGEEFAEHGGYEHGAGKVFDENVHVPLLVRPPGGLAGDGEPAPEQGAGRRVRTPATSLDLAPTLLAWAGAEDPGLPGRSLLELAAEDDPGRPVLVHGINSLDTLDERRFRLDRGAETLVLDRVSSVLFHFDRAADPAMRRPWRITGEAFRTGPPPEAAAAPGSTLEMLRRLQAVVAWGEGQGLAVPLAGEAGRVQVRRTSSLVPRGLWDGVLRHPLTAEARSAPRTAGWPGLLVFRLDASRRPREIHLQPAGGPASAARPMALQGARWTEEPGWSPLEGRLPGPGEIFRAAERRRAADRLHLDDEAREELRALGYLR